MEIPRHLTTAASTSASSSPIGTPPQSNSQPRSPAGSTSALASTGTGTSSPSTSTNPPLPSPGGSSNRFGLALGSLGFRRPRGSTNPLSMSPGQGGSPSSENPPSPSGGERTTGYGFPALRRQLSRRTGGSSGDAATSRTRASRSSSQPPQPFVDGTAPTDSRPSTPLDPPQPPFATLTQTSSLPVGASSSTAADGASTPSNAAATHRIRIVPHLESSRSLHFEPIDRDLAGFTVLKVGRFTDRSHSGGGDPLRIAFKSKVVSRGHAEIWCDDLGKFYIRDTKSSSGTFLNHIRLSGPGVESKPFPVKDGDVLQLGVDYQGGTEEIYRCVKMRIELNRAWQRGMNNFNTQALAQLRALGGGSQMDVNGNSSSGGAPMSAAPTQKATAPMASVTDCCICLYPVTVCQALFIAPCSHVTHFKCIRPLIDQNYPGFSCPLCRTYADLEADVEIEPYEPEEPVAVAPPETVEEEAEAEEAAEAMDGVNSTSRAPSVRSPKPDDARRSSIAVAGADGQVVPLDISEHHRPSAVAYNPEDDVDSSSHPVAMAIAGASSSAPDNNNFDAATPPNSTFLSTLAESGKYPWLQVTPVSLDHAVLGAAPGPSTSGQQGRRSVGSDDETESSGDAESEEAPTNGGESKGKGKGVEGRITSPNGAHHSQPSAVKDVTMDVDENEMEGVIMAFDDALIKTYQLGTFVTQAGEEISDAFIAYKTFGSPDKPAILYPTWYSGFIKDNEWLISKGHKSLNPENYFIIIPAMFGNSQSSSPSNHALGVKFPHTSMYDNVRAQHELVTKEFKITKLFAVLGWSMGAGQTFQWCVAYPDMVERAVPFCGAARTAHHNITFLRSLILTLQLDPAYKAGNYAVGDQPQAGKEAFAAIYSAWGFSQAFYREELFKGAPYHCATRDQFMDSFWTPLFAHKDANNLLHMLRTWIAADITCTPDKPFTHDPQAGRSSTEDYIRALDSIKAKILVVPCRTDLYFPPEDSEFEVKYIGSNAKLDVMESIWGHFAGGPGDNPEDVMDLDGKIARFFEETKELPNVGELSI
ncbi:zinc finger, RING-type and FHA domain containing protein [Pseudohyphozyma bogoriensis]|nr:zinc finger, RING-type and FHA domain containing protein [Pseudohyphozyma bogoriensis]